ncbi:hypothetical protein BX666DRAFT_1815236, partial [Dichotomocladium elegans]
SWQSSIKSQTTSAFDICEASPLNLLANTLNESTLAYKHGILPATGTRVPATYHHVYFPPRTLETELARDGYETDFHPPKPFVERMWAGATLTFSPTNPLVVGDKVKMTTSVDRVEHKTGGRLGDAVMVWLNKDIRNQQGWAMREQRCLVYATQGDHAPPRPITGMYNTLRNKVPAFSETVHPTPVLLFRYSALTFNAHLIHYDHQYATTVEKHPARLVHGPLSSTLLISLLRSHVKAKYDLDLDEHIQSFDYRCLMPLYVDQPFTLCGRESTAQGTKKSFDLWIVNHHNHLALKG